MTQELLRDWVEGIDYQRPRRGELRKGILLAIDDYGAFIDIGLKHDGFVSRKDIDNLSDDILSGLAPGQEVTTQIVRPVDQEGSLKLSLSKVQEQKDWEEAEKLFNKDEIWHGKVFAYNRGGLLVSFKQIQAFIPASHLWGWDGRFPSSDQRDEKLEEYIDQELALKFIEVDQIANRLIASERLAKQQVRQENLDRLLEELSEDDVCKGTVRHITDYGAFIDIGGVDGLLHISEMSWRRVHHPKDVVEVGQELDVSILDIDHEEKRISLSLKRLEANPWDRVEELYSVGEMVSGTVTNVVKFGAFVALEAGVEGLLHVSEIADPPPDDPREFVDRGEELTIRILKIEPERKRISLSLKWTPQNMN